MKSLNLFFVAFLFSSWAQAASDWYRIGAVICPSQVRLLDFYEGEKLRGLHYEDEMPLSQMTEHFRALMPDRALAAEQASLRFAEIKQIRKSIDWGSMDLADLILKLPTDCQIGILLKTDFRSELLLNEDIWFRLAATDQAGAVLHWALAKEVFESERQFPKFSIYIRALNSLLPIQDLHDLCFEEFVASLKAAGLPSVRKQGVLIDLKKDLQIFDDRLLRAFPIVGSSWVYTPPAGSQTKSQSMKLKADPVSFYPNGQVKAIRYEGKMRIPTIGGELLVEARDNVSNSPFEFERQAWVRFFENGILESALVLEPLLFQSDLMKLKLAQHQGRWDNFKVSRIYFEPNGKVSTITNAGGSIYLQGEWIGVEKNMAIELWDGDSFKEFTTTDRFAYLVQGQKILWSRFMMLDPAGRIQCGYLAQPATFQNSKGTTTSFRKDEQVCFDDKELTN